MKSQYNSKRIVKNTFFLYTRMLLLLFVSLLTARVMLDALGAEDYGLNNVIAGVVTLFSFLNNTLTTATSRYLTYEIGTGNITKLKNTFSNSVLTHSIIGFIVIILGETLGLYFVNAILNIPDNRLFACNIAFQIVIISTFFTLVQTPFSAIIISYERMGLYAYMGCFDAIAKLISCYIVKISPYDKLITLSILQGLISLTVFIIYLIYCKTRCKEAFSISLRLNKSIATPMLKFTTWSLLGSIANMLKNQGINILINLFFGPTTNAANAIAYRINAAITGFTANFTTALNPQIIKTYAAKEFIEMKKVLFRGGKFSFYLLMLLGFPAIFETPFILRIWLGDNIPAYTSIMTKLIIVLSMIETFTYSIGCAIQATGNIRNYQLLISGISLLNFPISYLFYKNGFPPYTALGISIIISFITLISRLYFMKIQLSIPPSEYIRNVFCRTFLVAIVCLPTPLVIYNIMQEGGLRFIILCLLTTFTNLICIWFLGMLKDERLFIKKIFYNIKSKKHIKI